jgi:hypothetical protein
MARKHKLPKHIGGVKIPKEWRKTAEDVLDRVDTPMARELAATAVIAVGAAIARAETKRHAREKSADQPEPPRTVPVSPDRAHEETDGHIGAAGAKLAATAAGIAAAALDGWLNKRGRPDADRGDHPATPSAAAPSAGAATH